MRNVHARFCANPGGDSRGVREEGSTGNQAQSHEGDDTREHQHQHGRGTLLAQEFLLSLGTVNAFSAAALLGEACSLDALLNADDARREAIQKQLAKQVRLKLSAGGSSSGAWVAACSPLQKGAIEVGIRRPQICGRSTSVYLT